MNIVRTRQRPLLVLVDAFFTVLAWVGLLYLLVRGIWPLIEPNGYFKVESSMLDALGTLHVYLWVALLNAVILIAWARYQHRKSKRYARRRLPAPVVDDEGLSKSFKLTGDSLARLRQLGTMVIYNNEAGDVSQVITGFLRIAPPACQPLQPTVSMVG
ncbi:biofilm PGA synthesis protein PgaD [Pseudomonas sp. ok272]|uniref:poly-beta-1,6-N-acetyl-D-glucosamine biosynthesis protein PgaD n=1 Tax=unclassified Pseudomonas TaxID=196821 RepID=UPI0008CE5C20|nr:MULTISPECIES: poly-beta-1,6-N-acetyl-D-glucosamine biosynthesis protein PgaD [unclassified Pseudomonas]SEN44800.1 biofilm PGA synthesis protein PgaD [Pseudomonas sp. ok272]SFM80815.1 biofilm PGA synthesis protein PgaD [Pseudomonas sp. ok602]